MAEIIFYTSNMQKKQQQFVWLVTCERTLSRWRVLSDERQEFILRLLESDATVPDSLS